MPNTAPLHFNHRITKIQKEASKTITSHIKIEVGTFRRKFTIQQSSSPFKTPHDYQSINKNYTPLSSRTAFSSRKKNYDRDSVVAIKSAFKMPIKR